jgi:hypothetical protein
MQQARYAERVRQSTGCIDQHGVVRAHSQRGTQQS